MKKHEQVLEDFNNAIAGVSDRNRQVLDDMEFAYVNGAQWRGSLAKQFKNKPKPENNKIARSINRIFGQFQRMEMNAKIVSASDDATDEDADLLQGRWRNDFNNSDGAEALNNSFFEALTGGFGAYKLCAKYDNEETPLDEMQHVEAEPIYSAASSVVFNAGAIRKDKADATQCWQLLRVNRREFEEDYDSISPFPNVTDYFDWVCDTNKDIYVAHYWEVITKRIKDYTFMSGDQVVSKVSKEGRKYTDEFGEKLDKAEFDLLMEMVDNGELIAEEKDRKCKQVEYALMSGDRFLERTRVTPFKRIPVIPQYGYHTVINGIEHYFGEVSLQKDPQRFSNFAFSALMEILAQPQISKPIFDPQQVSNPAIQKQWATDGVENYAYLTAEALRDANGNVVQNGPIGMKTPPQVGPGLASALQYLGVMQTDQAGTGQSTLPSNTAAQAIQQVNERQDDTYQPIYQNAIHSMKSACECWIDAAKKLYFTNARKIRLLGEDGSTYSVTETLQYAPDQNGVYGPNKNTARGQYDVTVKIGQNHQSKREAERQANMEMLQFVGTDTELGQMIAYNALINTTGEGSSEIRRVARYKQLDMMLMSGIDPKPKNDEERQYIAQKAQQIVQQQQAMQQGMAQQQQAATQAQMQMIDAESRARMMEGQASIMGEENDRAKLAIDYQKMINDRMKIAGELDIKMTDSRLKQFEALAKRYQGSQE